MCNFCNDIKNIEEHREKRCWERCNAIVKKSNGIHSL